MSKNRLLICLVMLMLGTFSAKAQVRIIETVAGSGSGTSSGDSGPAIAAGIASPNDVVLDALGNMYIAEPVFSGGSGHIRRVDAITGIITTIAGGSTTLSDGGPANVASMNSPSAMAFDAAGDLYITQNQTFGGTDCRIRKIDMSTGIINTIAGDGTNTSAGDGGMAPGKVATPTGIVVDAAGNVYFSEAKTGSGSSHRIRMLSAAGMLSTIAGGAASGGGGDGAAASLASLNSPQGLALDAAGDLYIADKGNNRIRKITFSTGIISTVAGTGTSGSSGDGSPALIALLSGPTDVTFDNLGNMYIADAGNNRVRMVNTSGIISTVAGTSNGFAGDGGAATAAKLNTSGGFGGEGVFAFEGKIYISDKANNRIRLVKDNDPVKFKRGTRQNITVCQSSGANSMNATLAVIDSDYSQTETWNMTLSPGHGVLTASANAISVGGLLTPTTTVSYTPTAGYSGPDSFYYSVTDNGFTTAIDTVIINVFPLPSPGVITGPTSVCVGSSITLSDNVTGGTWMPNNFNASIGSASGIVLGMSAGTTIMTYTIGNQCQTVTATYTTTINPLPASGLVFGQSNVCVGTSITLSDAAPGGVWISSDGLKASVSGGVVNGISNGTVQISYSVTNMCGTAISQSTVNVISVLPPGTITGATSVCQGSTITLADPTPGGIWSSSNTNAFVSGGIVNGLSAGPATISYSFTNLCGTTNATYPITVNPLPNAGVITGPSAVCLAATITLADATAGGIWGEVTSGTTITGGGVATGVFGGIDTVTYSVTNMCGTARAVYPVNVIAIPSAGTITGPVSTCEGSAIAVTDGVAGGVWSVSNGNAVISAGGIVAGVSAGIDTVLYTVTYSCGSDVASFPVTIDPLATAGVITGSSNACPGTTVTLADAITGGVWSASGAAATISTSGVVTGVSAGSVIVSYSVTNVCGSAVASKTVTVYPVVSASVSTAASPDKTLCGVTSPITFTPTPVNGGSAPAYTWFVNGVPRSTGPTYTYSPADLDVVRCLLTSNAQCAIPDTASANITISIIPARVPAVTISVPNDTVCSPSVIAYSVTPVNGGTTPIYQWNKNGVNVGTGPIYGTIPANGDIVYCTMTSNLWCITAPTATSNTIIMHLETPAANTVSVHASKSAIFIGTVDTFIAVAPHAGSTALYQWRINGVAVPGVTSPIYITDSLKPGQVITCLVTSDDVCVTPHTVGSLGITVLVATGVNNQVAANGFTLMPNPNNGSFTIKGSSGSADENVALEITNMVGQVVYRETVPVQNGMLDKQISVGNELPNGLYLLHIMKDGEPTVIRFTISK